MSDILERLDKAHKMVAELASSGLKSWRMYIPAREDDTDIFLCGTISQAKAELETANKRIEKLEAVLKEASIRLTGIYNAYANKKGLKIIIDSINRVLEWTND